MRVFLLILTLFVLLMHEVYMVHAEAKKDKTREAGEKGEDVVTAVVNQIRQSRIFPNDNQFLRRIAWVESNFGNNPQTYRQGYHGGIWQVDQIGFRATKDVASHTSLIERQKDIITKFGIRWENVKWEDLRKPLYSGLAARLFLSVKPGAIPPASDIKGQAQYWKEHYNTNAGAGTAEVFENKVKQLNDLQTSSCKVNIDLVFVMDSSGSIGTENFERMKTFVRDFASGLDIGRENSQVAVITYSNDATLQFGLNQYSTKNSLLAAIEGIPYVGGGTDTAEALDAILSYGFTESNGARSQVLRIAIVMTDGQSNCFDCTLDAAGRVHGTRPLILSYAIGIGSNINQEELEAIASRPEFVVQLESFASDQFRTFQEERTQEICFELSTPANPGEKRNGNLPKGDEQRLVFPLSEEGLTVHLCVKAGRIVFYAARAGQPNEAFYDFKIVVEAGCHTALLTGLGIERKKRQADAEEKIFVTIRGEADGDNSFELDSSTSTPGEAVQIEPKVQPTVTEGQSIAFSCVGADPSSIVIGRRTDNADVTNLPPFGSRLQIVGMSEQRINYTLGPLSADDHTTFLYCSSGAFISTEVQLTVYFSPRYQELPSSVLTVVQRQTATLNFELSANPPPNLTEYSWYKDGQILEPSYRVNTAADSLTFNPAYAGDVGRYTVTAYNSLGNGSLSFQLNVDFAPRFYAEHFGSFICQKVGRLIECIAPEGGTGYLNCAAFGNPRATLTLETRDSSTENVDFNAENGDVLIRDVSVDNEGFYTCVATNYVREARRTFSLLVGDGNLPVLEDMRVTVRRLRDDFVAVAEWNYDTSTLTLPPARFHLSLYAVDTTRRIATWVVPRESRSYTLSLKELNLSPRTTYRVEILAENALNRSDASSATFSLPVCPPVCSMEYCSAKQTRRAMCTMTSAMRKSNCSVLCPVTLCHACYYTEGEARDSSLYTCRHCSDGYVSNTVTQVTTCFKRWAQCVRGANYGLYRKPSRTQQTQENFKCYEHPCV